MSLFTFFFHDTATTEIYTYGHTLSLHDALPIWRGHATRTAARSAAAAPPPRPREPAADSTPAAAPSRGRRQPAAVRRSAEHTSALQPLMRTSYAVFCLKKQNNTANKLDTPHCHYYIDNQYFSSIPSTSNA